jgi:hypothetical protein
MMTENENTLLLLLLSSLSSLPLSPLSSSSPSSFGETTKWLTSSDVSDKYEYV